MTTNDRRGTVVAWGLLVLLVANVPLFLCMPLTDDAAMFDLQARNLLGGGVLYRDIVEPNLPGVIWIQAAVRATLGESSLALRALDLLLFTAWAVTSRHWLAVSGATRAAQTWLVLVLFVCYFSFSEWCHCQRDVWLLTVGLAALTLRRRQAERLRSWAESGQREATGSEPEQPGPAEARVGLVFVGWALLEGLCWGVGVWLKPMIVVPAACCWMLSVLYVRQWRRTLVDLAGLVSGGLLAGGLGVAWLVWSGAWPHFLATLIDWNPAYVAAGREQWTLARYVAMQVRFFPWQLLHLAAIPLALTALVRGARRWGKREGVEESRRTGADPSDSSTFPLFHSFTSALLSVFYLAWLVQSYLLQHLFDYVHAPALLLAIVVVGVAVAGRSGKSERRAKPGRVLRRFAVGGFAVLVVLTTPVLSFPRLAWWPACMAHGSTAPVRDRLKTFSVPSWQDLDRVAEFLRGQGIRDGELTCYNSSLVHLYGMMGVEPSTRYVYLEQVVAYFPDRQDEFLRALSDSRQRYVVTDLIASGLSPTSIARLCDEGLLEKPPRFPSRLRDVFPWSQPAVFRAGPYLVHQVERRLGRLEGPRRAT
ncbi:MAG: type IV toxin-antitoxin system AbiEi family antitoxin domain-containing protein [Candidatus Anammoximicrobium sp.]|nr:type IV toxin-antitoxin system AbiEi family antitoxin domain-containing protein [Candidatus Anammoximicrobium sp.]